MSREQLIQHLADMFYNDVPMSRNGVQELTDLLTATIEVETTQESNVSMLVESLARATKLLARRVRELG